MQKMCGSSDAFRRISKQDKTECGCVCHRMPLNIESVCQRLHKCGSAILVLANIMKKSTDNCFVKPLGLSVVLEMIGGGLH